MKPKPPLGSPALALLAAGTLLLGTGGCLSNNPAYRTSPHGPLGTAGVYVDDYDYFPGYETYYSRTTHEYYYREGSTWISRPQPRGVTVEVLLAAPSVRMNFHDSPKAHHSAVVQTYPRNWQRSEPNHDNKPGTTGHQPTKGKSEPRKDDAKNERKHDARDDRKDEERKK